MSELGAAAEGLVTRPGAADVATTLKQLRAAIEAAGAKVIAVVDHAAAAESVGMALRPTTVVIFGNPKAGTPLMQVSQTVGLDLPLKVLVWRDEAGATRLTYAEPAWIARRHGIDPAAPAVAGLTRALETFVAAAAQG
jgi:uncharacterized protein (DUF302 family)